MTKVFQRTQASVVVTNSTISTAGFTSVQITGYAVVEVSNSSTTCAQAFTFDGTAPTLTTSRICPASGVVQEVLPQGSSCVAAIPFVAAGGTLVFTPGKLTP